MAIPDLKNSERVTLPPSETEGEFRVQPEKMKAVERLPGVEAKQSHIDEATAAEVIRKIQAGQPLGEKDGAVLDNRGTQQFFDSLTGTPREKLNQLGLRLKAEGNERAFQATIGDIVEDNKETKASPDIDEI